MYNMLNYIVTVFISMITGIFGHRSAGTVRRERKFGNAFRTIGSMSAGADKE